MKGLKPFPLIGFAILLCALISGCASHAPQSGPGALNVSQFNLNPGAIGVPYQQVLIASGGQTPYTWTLTNGTLPPGLSLQSNGIVSGTPTLVSGVIYPTTYNFSATVTDSQTPIPAYNTLATSVVINPALTFPPATLPPGLVGSNYSSSVSASGGIVPYTYNIVFGSLPDGLTLTGSGTGAGNISGTATTAGTFTFTVQATDAVSETATEAFTITITGKLQGNYAFSLNGFDTANNGHPFYIAGSFCADGNGNINPSGNPSCPGSQTPCGNSPSGVYVLDQIGLNGVQTCVPFTGTYTLPTGTNFGSMVLTSPAFGSYFFDILIGSSQTRLIMTNPTLYGSGQITQQASTTLPSTGAGYSFGAFGTDANGNRYAGAGAFAINSSLGVTGGEEDINDNGTVNNGTGSPIPITTGTLTVPDANTGRGTASLTTALGTSNYAYYVISNNSLVAIDTDSGGPATLLSIMQQGAAGTIGGTSFTNASLKGQSLMQLTALNSSGLPDISAGVVSFDGAGNVARTDGLPGYYTDENNGGTVTSNSIVSGTYSVDPSCPIPPSNSACGRVTVSLTGVTNPPVWYLTSTDQAFVVGTDPSVTSGSFVQQTVPGSGFSIASILGSYLGGTSNPVTASVTNELDVALTPPPGGILSLTSETSGPGGSPPQQHFVAYYDCADTPGSTTCSAMGTFFGRFEVTTANTPPSPQISILYIIGGGTSGITGGKTGLVGVDLGTITGAPEPNPRITNYGR
jgi:Putative Ig domain